MRQLLSIFLLLILFVGCSDKDENDLSLPIDEADEYDVEWFGGVWVKYLEVPNQEVRVEIDYSKSGDNWLEVECNQSNVVITFLPCIDSERSADVKIYDQSKIYKLHFTQSKLKETDDVSPLFQNERELETYLRENGYCEGGNIYLRNLRQVKRLDHVHIQNAVILGLFPELEFLMVFVNTGIVDLSLINKIDTCDIEDFGYGGVSVKDIQKVKNLKYLNLYGIRDQNAVIDLSNNNELVRVEIMNSDYANIKFPSSVEEIELSGLRNVESLDLPNSLKEMSVYDLRSLKQIDISKTQIGRTDIINPLHIEDVSGDNKKFNIYVNQEQLNSINDHKWEIKFLANTHNPIFSTSYQLKLADFDLVEPRFTAELLDVGAKILSVYFNFAEKGNLEIKEMRGRCDTTPWDESRDPYHNGFHYGWEYLWLDFETKVIGCQFWNLTPGTTYYVQLAVVTETQTWYLSDELIVTMEEYVEPVIDITKIEPSYDGAKVVYSVENFGYTTEGKSTVLIGETPNITEDSAIFTSEPRSWFIRKGQRIEIDIEVEKLEPKTRYYARIATIWKEDSKTLYSDPVEFNTEAMPEIPTNLIWYTFHTQTNQTIQYTSGYKISAAIYFVALFDRFDPGDKFYFESDHKTYIPNMAPNILDTENGIMCFDDSNYSFYWYSKPWKNPEIKFRAVVVKADGREYYSPWRETSFVYK
ncbi:MAG: hypothetical protein NC102_09580 [Clostridium sp.]|nr:hypothetical protein [Clostridium sp.]